MHAAHVRPGHLPVQARWFALLLVWAITTVLLPLRSQPASAATLPITIAVPQFDTTNTGAWQLNQQAVFTNNQLHLTPASTDQVGTAFYKQRVSLANERSFSAYFVMAFPNPGGKAPGGADGLVFTLQTQSNTAGSPGGGLGYEGITPSVGIEFDTWKNQGDPDDNHVGLNVGGSVNSVQTASPPSSLGSNTTHVWVDYNGATDRLEVRMHRSEDRDAATLVLATTRDLTADVGQDVFIGFTAATGDAFENHDILALYFANDYLPIDTRRNIYQHAPSALTVSTDRPAIENDGTERATITATVYGSDQQRMVGQTVTFRTDFGTLSAATATTDANGEARVTLSGRNIGTANIRATAVGGVYDETAVAIYGVVYFPILTYYGYPHIIYGAP